MSAGFTAALEDQGYLADPAAQPTRVLPGWSVEAAAASGASAVKLLLPYVPGNSMAAVQEAVALGVAAQSQRLGIP
ncbi:MAG: hypothetical protein HC937_01135, partial [Aquincola sp.]|nr:hypothetical protein [Aquincola sp.]